MTENEAIEKAKKELSYASYLSECGKNEGIRKIYADRAEWLGWVIYLAEKGKGNDYTDNERNANSISFF